MKEAQSIPSPAIPQGDFRKLRDLVSQAMHETMHNPKNARLKALDWLLNREDLCRRFLHPIVLEQIDKEIQALYHQQPVGRPRQRIPASNVPADEDTDEEVWDLTGLQPLAGDQDDAAREDDAVVWPAEARTYDTAFQALRDDLAQWRTPEDWKNEVLRPGGYSMDDTLPDGTRIGDATRTHLFVAANTALAQAKQKYIQRNYYYLLARCLPDDTRRVQDYFTGEELERIGLQAETYQD